MALTLILDWRRPRHRSGWEWNRWSMTQGYFHDITMTLVRLDPFWLDSGPQPCLSIRTTLGSLPGHDSQAKTGVGVKGPGHRRFVNCSGAFPDEKNLRTPLQLLSWPSGYFMFSEESYGSITNLTWTFVLRKVSLFTRRVNFSIISIFQISLQAKLCRSHIHSWLRQQKHGIRFHYSVEPPLLPGN